MLGILSLDTTFERVISDAGNPLSYPFDARIKLVTGAEPPSIVRGFSPDADLTKCFLDAAKELEEEGAQAIISTCGFLAHIQNVIARSCSVPVMMSALSLAPIIYRLTARPVGILTANKEQLGADILKAVGIAQESVQVAGMEKHPAFSDVFLCEKAAAKPLITCKVRDAAIAEATSLVFRYPDVGSIILECGNLPPYADAIKTATGRPVYSILDGASLMMSQFIT